MFVYNTLSGQGSGPYWIKSVCVFQAKQSLATLTKDVPKRHSLAMPTETVVNGNQEWAMHAELPLTAAIRQSQQNLYHSMDRQGTHTHTHTHTLHLQQWPVHLKSSTRKLRITYAKWVKISLLILLMFVSVSTESITVHVRCWRHQHDVISRSQDQSVSL